MTLRRQNGQVYQRHPDDVKFFHGQPPETDRNQNDEESNDENILRRWQDSLQNHMYDEENDDLVDETHNNVHPEADIHQRALRNPANVNTRPARIPKPNPRYYNEEMVNQIYV